MTANRRIFYNVIFTYARSLYALGLGLFSTRWVLLSLGQVDYGLWGLITGMTAFVSFFNALLSSAIGRFYAISISAKKTNNLRCIIEARKWFSTAIIVQIIIPIALICVGYPTGNWMIRHYLDIPIARIDVCLIVWQYACLSCFIAMVSVPFCAMFYAKQEIAELTVYGLASTTLNFIFVYYMYTHPDDWLARYSIITCCIGAVPQLLISVRACIVYPECCFHMKYAFELQRLKKLFSFVGWQTFGNLGCLIKWQGVALLVNKYFGAKINAANSIDMSLSHHCNSLSASIQTSFAPAIMNAYGSGDYDKAKKLAYQACIFGAFSILIFALPLIIEIKEVLRIWLKEPPLFASWFAIWILVDLIIDRTTMGYMVLVDARGKIALYQIFYGVSIALTLPLSWMLIWCDVGVYSIGAGILISKIICTYGRVKMAKSLVDLKSVDWLRRVFVPIVTISVVAICVGSLPHVFMDPSFYRIFVTTLLVEISLFSLGWMLLLDSADKTYVKSKLLKIQPKLVGKDEIGKRM